MNDEFDNISFGKVGNPKINWREFNIPLLANDEDLPVEADVLSILGFDPDEEDYNEELTDITNDWEEVERDQRGRWTSTGANSGSPLKSKSLFSHGTTIEAANKILEEGLVIGRGDSNTRAIFASSYEQDAHEYAAGKVVWNTELKTPGLKTDEYAIIKFKATPGMNKIPDRGEDYVFWENNIPSSYIEGVDIYKFTMVEDASGDLKSKKLINRIRRSKGVKNIDDNYFYTVIVPDVTEQTNIKNDWEEVERVAKGEPGGGQWKGNNTGRSRFSKEVAKDETSAEETIKEFKPFATADEQWAVDEYTNDGFQDLNDHLRNNTDKRHWSMNQKLIQKELDTFLKDAPKFNGNVFRGIIFRSLSAGDTFLEKAREGAILQDRGYMSTSVDTNKVYDFAGGKQSSSEVPKIYMVIKSKTGVYLNGLSHNSLEKEVLFKRGSKFKVIKISSDSPEFSDFPSHNLHKTFITLEEI